MNEWPVDNADARLRGLAAFYPYPTTPDIAPRVRRRLAALAPTGRTRRDIRPAWALALLLLVVALVVLGSPTVRANLQAWLQLGQIRIFPAPATPAGPGKDITPAAADRPLFPPLDDSLDALDLPGATTLAAAQAALPFAVPQGRPPPDLVFHVGGAAGYATLIWLDGHDPEQPIMLLQVLGSDVLATKIQPLATEETTVQGRPALWVSGAHELALYDQGLGQDQSFRRRVTGSVLIWTQDGLTYRLELSGTLEEARAIAESLGPPP